MINKVYLCEYGTLMCKTRELALTNYDFDLIIITYYCQSSEELTQLFILAKSTVEICYFTFSLFFPLSRNRIISYNITIKQLPTCSTNSQDIKIMSIHLRNVIYSSDGIQFSMKLFSGSLSAYYQILSNIIKYNRIQLALIISQGTTGNIFHRDGLREKRVYYNFDINISWIYCRKLKGA